MKTKYIIKMLAIIIIFITFCVVQAQSPCDQAKDLYKNALSTQNSADRVIIYQKAIQLCPDFAEAHNNLADAYDKIGYIDKAEEEYKEALHLNPKLVAAYLSLGDINFHRENYSKAVEYYEKGLVLYPQDETAQRNLTIAKEKASQPLMRKTETNQVMTAREIVDRLDQTKTMGVGGVSRGENRIAFKNILFEFNSDRFKKESLMQLNEIGNALSTLVSEKDMRFIIGGHTDNIGGDAFNKELSEKRAEAVKKYLVRIFGISEKKLKIAGYGKTRPIDNNSTEVGRQNNRRVEIVRD